MLFPAARAHHYLKVFKMLTELQTRAENNLYDLSVPPQPITQDTARLSLEDLTDSIERIFPLLTPQERLPYIFQSSGLPTMLTTSGGTQSATLLSLISDLRNTPLEAETSARLHHLPVIFLDTGDLFPETHQYIRYLSAELGLSIQKYRHALTPHELEQNIEFLVQAGSSRYDAFDQLTKVRPLQQIIDDLGVQIWISGNRRDQTAGRSDLPFAEIKNGTLKVYPLADQSGAESRVIFENRGLAPHPLSDRYRSIGNRLDTLPSTEGFEKAGRHLGLKQECGLHQHWVRRGETLVLDNGRLILAERFPLVRETIAPGPAVGRYESPQGLVHTAL